MLLNFFPPRNSRLSWYCLGPIVDTVIMNPPFGTRKVGADLDFLSVALKVSNNIKAWLSMQD